MSWHRETLRTAAPGSDVWPVTRDPDGHVYTSWGDGGGFGGTNSDGRVAMGFARIKGPPEKFRAVNINGGKNALHPASFPKRGKTGGIVAVDGTLGVFDAAEPWGPWTTVAYHDNWLDLKGTGLKRHMLYINIPAKWTNRWPKLGACWTGSSSLSLARPAPFTARRSGKPQWRPAIGWTMGRDLQRLWCTDTETRGAATKTLLARRSLRLPSTDGE